MKTTYRSLFLTCDACKMQVDSDAKHCKHCGKIIWLKDVSDSAISAVIEAQEQKADCTENDNIRDGVSGPFIGIDIGTEKSRIAVVKNGSPMIIPNSEGERSTPTYITITKDGQRVIGAAAKRQAVTNPERTIHSFIMDLGSEKTYYIDEMEYEPRYFYQMLLQKLKTDAEAYLGEKVHNAVIAVPSSFDYIQRKEVKHAAVLAGFTKIRIINECGAAALTYIYFAKEEERVIIYNWGAGSLDVSLTEMSEGIAEVLEIEGQSNLGGNDFDDRIVRWMLEEYKKNEGIDLTNNKMALQRIQEVAESAKKSLSNKPWADIRFEYKGVTMEDTKHLSLRLTREKFEELTKDLIDKAKNVLDKLVKWAEENTYKPDRVFLTGGTTRIPSVQEMIKKTTNLAIRKSSNPEESVVKGAALLGGHIKGECGRVAEILLMEILTHSLCMETEDGTATTVIWKNTVVPVRKRFLLSTIADNQTTIDINILQGEEKSVKDNKVLGTLRLDGIPPAPKGVSQLEVVFDVDVNGLLEVKAKELATGKEAKMRVNI